MLTTAKTVMQEIENGDRAGSPISRENVLAAATEVREMIKRDGGKRIISEEKVYKGVGASVKEGMSVEQQLQQAGLNWEVAQSAIRYGDCFQHVEMKGQAIYRKDNGQLLTTTLGESWQPFQNREVVECFNQFADEAGIEIERVGSLKDGKLIFASAIANESWDVLGSGDTIAARILLTNSHEYGKGLTIKLNAIRLVCANGLTERVSIGAKTISHRGEFSPNQVLAILSASQSSFIEFGTTADALARIELTNNEAYELLVTSKALQGDRDKALEDQPKLIQAAYGDFANNTAIGAEIESARGTAWGLLNAVTQHVNHDNVRQGDTHLNSLWHGTKAAKQSSFMAYLMTSLNQEKLAQKYLED